WFLVLGSWFLVLGSWFFESIGDQVPSTKYQVPDVVKRKKEKEKTGKNSTRQIGEPEEKCTIGNSQVQGDNIKQIF
ncbi:MAG TPA: hypothetical protein PKZ53_13505, partial [Acidobacteriota bacterium]|nr:hypothetical protein [Acidobacteriota bacterium]